MPTYKLQANYDINGNIKSPNTVIKDGSMWIPFDKDNTDAKEFAKWLSEGGIPEPAVEGETVSAEWIAETIAKLS